MKNPYLKNLNKIEFALTYACTGKCKHCSVGTHVNTHDMIDSKTAAEAVYQISSVYDIKTVMVFGGEPLLHTGAVYEIMRVARELDIPRRQVITNGYFSTDAERLGEVAKMLADCGVNDLLLSVDAFHQETIPIDVVKSFAEKLLFFGVPVRLQPAWLVSASDNNPYNRKTVEILDSFEDLKIPTGEGNVVFPEGNALKYLSDYFTDSLVENPYTDDPCDVKCVSISPNGDVLGGNIYNKDIMRIIEDYIP